MSITRSIFVIAVPVLVIAACSADLQDMNAPYAVARSWCEKRASCGDPTVGDPGECIDRTEKLVRNGGASFFVSSTPTTEDKDRLFACADAIRDGDCPAQFGPAPTTCGIGGSFSADTGAADTGSSSSETGGGGLSCKFTGSSCTFGAGVSGRLYSCNRPPEDENCRASGTMASAYCCTSAPAF